MDSFDEIRTTRLRLRRLKSNDVDSQDLEWFHTVWSNDQATQWSTRGPCKTKQESSDWMAGIVPKPVPDHRTRIAYVVFCQSSSDPVTPLAGDATTPVEDGWEVAGIVTLLSPTGSDSNSASTSGTQVNLRPIELGYLFLPSAWGRGFATESLHKLLELYEEVIASTERNVHIDLYAYVHLRNSRSIRVVQKLGLREITRFEKDVWLPLEQRRSVESIARFHKPLY